MYITWTENVNLCKILNLQCTDALSLYVVFCTSSYGNLGRIHLEYMYMYQIPTLGHLTVKFTTSSYFTILYIQVGVFMLINMIIHVLYCRGMTLPWQLPSLTSLIFSLILCRGMN